MFNCSDWPSDVIGLGPRGGERLWSFVLSCGVTWHVAISWIRLCGLDPRGFCLPSVIHGFIVKQLLKMKWFDLAKLSFEEALKGKRGILGPRELFPRWVSSGDARMWAAEPLRPKRGWSPSIPKRLVSSQRHVVQDAWRSKACKKKALPQPKVQGCLGIAFLVDIRKWQFHGLRV